MKSSEFFDYVVEKITPYDFKLFLGTGSNLNCDEERVQGYFDDQERVVAVATGTKCTNRSILEVLVHEYCHFEQWRKQVKPWTNAINLTNEKFKEIFDSTLPWSKQMEHCLDLTIDLELDCERRAIRLIEKLDLPINTKVYARKANSYLYFYSYLRERRAWYPNGRAPYKIRKIYNMLPDKLKTGYKRIPEELLIEFRKQYG